VRFPSFPVISVIWYFGFWFGRWSSPTGKGEVIFVFAAARLAFDCLGSFDLGSGWMKWFWFQGAEGPARMASQIMASEAGSEARVEGYTALR
jgi:hypothetical protein